MHLKQSRDQSIFSSSPGEMEVDVDDSPTTSPIKQNGMVVEVAGPVVIQYKDKKNREKDKKMKNDCYCWICHHTGNMLCCERCPRVFHLKCIPLTEEPDDDWICPCCAHLEECKKLGDRSKCCRTNLAKMLPYALDRMSSSGTEAFQQPVTTDVAPNYFDFVHYPMDMGTLRQKAKAGVWQCTQHFLDNARWILHNCIIFNGGKSRLTALARTVYNVCQHEMLEISLCPDCFLNSCTADKDWFTRVCKKTHRLVWAKLRGFPFWPAKVLQRQGQQIDVRFFGQHERAWVHESNTLDISEDPPAGNRNKEAGSNRVAAEEEMNRYVENLKKAGRWPIDMSKVKEERDDDDEDERSVTENSAPRKKKKEKIPSLKEPPVSKAPKLKISSNSLLKDERVSSAFKFDDAELKGTVKADRTPQPSGKRRKTDDKIKIDIEPDRLKFSNKKLAFKKSTSYSSLVNSTSNSVSSDNIVEKVFSVTSNGCNAWKYQNRLMEAISGMVEEMLEETKHKYKTEAEKAVELAKMAAELEKETFKLEVKRDSKCRSCKSKSSAENSSRHEEELRTALEEQRIQLEAEKDRQIEELRQHLTAEKEKAIVETKKSQWCANCSGPAMYHCCWNTSYCGYPCQRGHWPQHMYKCEQQNRSGNFTLLRAPHPTIPNRFMIQPRPLLNTHNHTTAYPSTPHQTSLNPTTPHQTSLHPTTPHQTSLHPILHHHLHFVVIFTLLKLEVVKLIWLLFAITGSASIVGGGSPLDDNALTPSLPHRTLIGNGNPELGIFLKELGIFLTVSESHGTVFLNIPYDTGDVEFALLLSCQFRSALRNFWNSDGTRPIPVFSSCHSYRSQNPQLERSDLLHPLGQHREYETFDKDSFNHGTYCMHGHTFLCIHQCIISYKEGLNPEHACKRVYINSCSCVCIDLNFDATSYVMRRYECGDGNCVIMYFSHGQCELPCVVFDEIECMCAGTEFALTLLDGISGTRRTSYLHNNADVIFSECLSFGDRAHGTYCELFLEMFLRVLWNVSNVIFTVAQAVDAIYDLISDIILMVTFLGMKLGAYLNDHVIEISRFSEVVIRQLVNLFTQYIKYMLMIKNMILGDLHNLYSEILSKLSPVDRPVISARPISDGTTQPAPSGNPLRPRRASFFQPPFVFVGSGTSFMTSCSPKTLNMFHMTSHSRSGRQQYKNQQYNNHAPRVILPRRAYKLSSLLLLVLLYSFSVVLFRLCLLLGREELRQHSIKKKNEDLNLISGKEETFFPILNQNLAVYMTLNGASGIDQDPDSDSQLSRTPNSTPKKSKFRSRILPSSQPLPKTLSPIWTPGQKIARRLRSFSQGSDASASGSDYSSKSSSKRTEKGKSRSHAKMIYEDGTFELDQKKKCTAHYMTTLLDGDEADRLQEDLMNNVKSASRIASQNSSAVGTKTGLTLNFNESNASSESQERRVDSELDPESEIVKQTKFLSERVEKVLHRVFDVNTKLSQVIIRRLPTYKDHIPYETWAGKLGANPVIAFLTLGGPRLLKLRRGSRHTHNVALHPGSLLTLAGNTSLEYSHSIPKGKVDLELEQTTLMFIGSPQEGKSISTSPLPSDNREESEQEVTTDDTADEPSESEYESDQISYPSLLPKLTDPPLVTVTDTLNNTHSELPETSPADSQPSGERMSDILRLGRLAQNPKTLCVNEAECANTDPHTPEECEKTVMGVIPTGHETAISETINMCVSLLPEGALTKELVRHRCQTDGSLDAKRQRLLVFLLSHTPAGSESKPANFDKSQGPSWVQSQVENSIIDLKSEIENLTNEVSQLKRVTTEKLNSNDMQSKMANLDRQTKKLNDLWEMNLTSTSSIKNLIDQVFIDINIAEQRASEVDNHLQRLKVDLKNYYNSAFYKEDSKLIKDMHNALCKDNVSRTDPAPSRGARQLSPAPVLPEFPAHPTRTIQHSTDSTDLQSRRDPGYTMTHAARQLDRANSQQFEYNPTLQPTQVQHNNPSREQPSRRGRGFTGLPSHGHRAAPPHQSNEPATLAERVSMYSPPRQSQQTVIIQGETRPARPIPHTNQQRSRKFKTALITDSILRHTQHISDALGVSHRHQLKVLHKRDTSGLTENELRRSLVELQPDFIYIHLGVNDISQGFHVTRSMDNITNFIMFRDEQIPRCKLFFSLPLLTRDPRLNEGINTLRMMINQLIAGIQGQVPLKDMELIVNKNTNFTYDRLPISEYLSNDGIHLSESGRKLILGNFRHHIHGVTRDILGMPPRESRREQERGSRSRESRYQGGPVRA